MKAMILAAGLGTRLRPVTFTLPKPLVPIGNQPLIAWDVEQFLRAGVTEIIVNLHHLPEPLERFLSDRFSHRCNLRFSFEPDILGTGGGLRNVRSLLENEEDFFLANGDTLKFPQHADMLRARRALDAVAAISLRRPPANDRFTPVYCERGLVTGFGTGRGEPLMFAGTHALSARVFEHLPDVEVFGIVDAVYQPVIASGAARLAGVLEDGLWFDIGTPLRYMTASHAVRDAMLGGSLAIPTASRIVGTSVIAESACVGGTVERSTIGTDSVVEAGAIIRDSVVWDGSRIGASVVLEGCVVTHDVDITRPLRARNALICAADAAIPRDAAYRIEGDLVVVPIDPATAVEI